MQRLKQVLADYALSAPKFGQDVTADRSSGDAAVAAQRKRDGVGRLRKDVQAIIERNNKYFRVCFGSVVLLYVAMILAVIIFVAKTGVVAGSLAGSGTAFAWIVRKMIMLWKEKVASELVLALAANLNPDDLKPILEVLVRTMK
jgi:hypothetical protein